MVIEKKVNFKSWKLKIIKQNYAESKKAFILSACCWNNEESQVSCKPP